MVDDMVKAKHVLGAIGVAGVGALIFGGRKTRASSKGVAAKPPSNLSFVDGKLDAVGAGARIAASRGPFVIVATDSAHRDLVNGVVVARARANPQFEYVLVDMDLARGLAADRGQALPEEAWGGVASILDGELVKHALFGADDAKPEVVEILEDVEGTVPGLGASSVALPPVTSGFLPPAEGS